LSMPLGLSRTIALRSVECSMALPNLPVVLQQVESVFQAQRMLTQSQNRGSRQVEKATRHGDELYKEKTRKENKPGPREHALQWTLSKLPQQENSLGSRGQEKRGMRQSLDLDTRYQGAGISRFDLLGRCVACKLSQVCVLSRAKESWSKVKKLLWRDSVM
jgi:hypothetical protein